MQTGRSTSCHGISTQRSAQAPCSAQRRELDGHVDRLRTPVHCSKLVETGHLAQLLAEHGVLRDMDTPRRHGQELALLHHGFHNSGVSVSLVASEKSGVEVDVPPAVEVPEELILAAHHDHGVGSHSLDDVDGFIVELVCRS